MTLTGRSYFQCVYTGSMCVQMSINIAFSYIIKLMDVITEMFSLHWKGEKW